MKEIYVSSFKIRKLWREFARKRFAVPEIQREFVWDANKACALLDSIYKKLPIGAVMVWDTDSHNHTLLRHHSQHVLPPFNPRNRRIWFLIDGQQRLSVLHQVREGQQVVNSNGKTVDFRRLHFVLDADASSCFVSVRRADPDAHFSVTDMLADDWQARIGLLPNYKRRKVRECRRRIVGYEVPVIFVKTNKLEEVREAFIRINSRGTPISAADRAFTRASRFNLRHHANTLRATLKNGFEHIPRETLLQSFALARGEKDVGERAVLAAIDKLEKRLRTDAGTIGQFQKDWKRVSHAIGKAVGYLVTTLGVPSYSYLPSDNMVATLALFFYFNGLSQPSPRQAREIRKWFWATGVGQRYAGRGFRRNVIKDASFFRVLATRRKGRFTFTDLVPRSEVKNSDYSRRSGLTNAFFCLLSVRQPRFLENGDRIPVEHSTRADRKDKHHIFPRDLLKRNGFNDRQYNSLCNVCFVVARENQSIGSQKPVRYLAEFSRKRFFGRVMASHLIPHPKDGGLWHKDPRRGYRQFQAERLDLLCRAFEREAGLRLFRQD